MKTRTSKKPRLSAEPSASEGFSLISNARLIQIYTAMLKCRMLREHLRRSGVAAGPRSASMFRSGSEAVAAGAVIDLLSGDTLASSDLFAAFVKGVPLQSLLRPILKPLTAGTGPHLTHGVLAGPLPASSLLSAAAGAAFAHKLNKSSKVTVAFCGESTSALREALDFVVAHDLAMIFVRQANSPFEALRTTTNAGRKSSIKTPSPNLPVIPVDRDDAIAVYRVAHEALAHARRGNGPTLIDCVPVRIPGRPSSGPIRHMEDYLAAKGLDAQRAKARVAADFAPALEAAIKEARRSAESRRGTRK